MTEFLILIAYATLPAFGNLAGNLLAEMVRPPRWVIGAALHGAAGIAIALISIDLMPRILQSVPLWGIVIAFLIGAAGSVLLARGVKRIRKIASGTNTQQAWMVYAAIGADLFSDGLMTGAGGAVSRHLGLLIAAAQLVANIPGGFASAANLRAHRVKMSQRMMASAVLFAFVIVSAMIGYLVLRGAGEGVQNAVLAAIAGLLLLATVEDMIPEADAPRPPRWISSLSFALGFAGLALASGYVF